MDFEQIKDKLKNIKPKQWLIIAGGVVLTIFIFRPRAEEMTEPGIVKSSGGGTSSPPAGLEGDSSGGMPAGMDSTISKIVADTQEGFDILKGQNQALQQTLTEIGNTNNTLKNSLLKMDEENDGLLDMIENLKDENDDLKQSYNQISNEFGSYLTNSKKQIGTVDDNYNQMKEDYAFESALNGLGSIYFNDKNDEDEYNTISKNIKNSTGTGGLTGGQASKVLEKIAGTGNDGIGNSGADYSEEKTNNLLNKIKNDSSVRQSEIERANQVIKNREKQGLDTSAQKNYLKTITGL
jgi:hypothetical protein